MDRLLYRPDEAAAVLGIGRSRLYELLASGEMSSVKIGRSRRVPVEALTAYVRHLPGAGRTCSGVDCQPHIAE